MKGPALQYDIRALRTFVCDACGRQCPLPGRFTSCQCNCSTPPRWMRMLDRQPVAVPDVSRFLSPADPADTAVDENESDEVIPGWKPPIIERVSQNPQRRRLSDAAPAATEGAPAEDTPQDDGFNPPASPTDTTARHELPRSDHGRVRERREPSGARDSRPPRHDRGRDSASQHPRRNSGRPTSRGAPDQRQPPGQHQQPALPPAPTAIPGDDFGSGVDSDPFTAPSADASGLSPERHVREDRGPRRGRRRGRSGPGARGSSGPGDG
ncbi:MAG: hypothetical protein ACKO2P_09605 [Planctomycetota bacterium]